MKTHCGIMLNVQFFIQNHANMFSNLNVQLFIANHSSKQTHTCKMHNDKNFPFGCEVVLNSTAYKHAYSFFN